VNRWLLLSLAATLCAAACTKKDEPAATGPVAPAAQPAAQPAASAQAPSTGKVLQLQHAGSYTYAEVDAGSGQKVWIAGAHIEVKEGDTVQWGRAEAMRNFNAKSLGRTFDEILFVNAWGPAGGQAVQVAPHGLDAAPPGGSPHPPMPAMTMAPQGGPAAAGPAQKGAVKSVANAAGYTYLEVDQGGTTTWLAVPETQVKAGDTVTWGEGMVMEKFNAKALNKVLDRIVFAGGVTVVK
jgi:hypothetical protein